MKTQDLSNIMKTFKDKLEFEDKLEEAISKWINSFTVDQLKAYVQDDLRHYYTNSADEEETLIFIQDMETLRVR